MSKVQSVRELLPEGGVGRGALDEVARRMILLEISERLPERLTDRNEPRLLPAELRWNSSGDSSSSAELEVLLLASDSSYGDLVRGSPLESMIKETVEECTGRVPELSVRTTGMVRLREQARVLSAELPPL